MPVADAELRRTLARVLGRDVRAIARRPNAYCSSYTVEDVEVSFGAGPPLTLVFKDLGGSALAPAAAAAKPAPLLDPAREIEAYTAVLGQAGVEAPACYGAVSEPGRHWLFLESVDGLPLWQLAEQQAWEAAADWLARLHSRTPPARHAHLLRYDEGYLRGWIERAVEFAPPGSLDVPAARWDRVVERLCAWPASVVHGDFYPSNVLVRRSGAGFGVVPVDWEMAGVGPGLLDLAALTSGGWSESERARLALAYRDALPPARRPSADELLDSLAHFRLYLAVQWLGWSRDWSPPAEHAHDWLAEALALCERLDP